MRNPEIIALASKIGRTPGAVSYKLANFASIDPTIDRKGASNIGKLDKEVWNEFMSNWNRMAYQSELRISDVFGKSIEQSWDDSLPYPEGKTRDSIIKSRINQNFFRKMILASYDETCCITGLNIPELLVASHIIPWAQDEPNRMNPRNGLCLNALHDRAFDKGIITISESFEVIVSKRVRKIPVEKAKIILDYEGFKVKLPRRFKPDSIFLTYHREHIFQA